MRILSSRIALVASILLLAAVAPMPIVDADRPTTGGGTIYNMVSVLVEYEQEADSALDIYRRTATGEIDGIIEGSIVVEERITLNWVKEFPYKGTFSHTYTCDPCTIEGRTGAATFQVHGTFEGLDLHGHLAHLSGTGDLAGLSGHGTVDLEIAFPPTEPLYMDGDYSVQIHFTPRNG